MIESARRSECEEIQVAPLGESDENPENETPERSRANAELFAEKRWLKILAGYRQPRAGRSAFELVVTVIPFALFWAAAWAAVHYSFWPGLILVLPADWDMFRDLRPFEYNVVSRARTRKTYGIDVTPVTAGTHGPDAISVRVKNYGSPIRADALQVIFNPLVQAPSPGSGPGDRRSTSLGLGLFIARTIVAGHGGTLEVESSEQGGTVFTARLPRQ